MRTMDSPRRRTTEVRWSEYFLKRVHVNSASGAKPSAPDFGETACAIGDSNLPDSFNTRRKPLVSLRIGFPRSFVDHLVLWECELGRERVSRRICPKTPGEPHAVPL